jgi:hypothetical protein
MQRHLTNPNWLLLAVVAGTWLAATPVAAQTYKWKDADGKIHYSDQPPPPEIKEPLSVKPRKSTAPSADGKGGADSQSQDLHGARGGVQKAPGRNGRTRGRGKKEGERGRRTKTELRAGTLAIERSSGWRTRREKTMPRGERNI